MAISSTDIVYRLSGGAGNSAAATSLGGVKSSVAAGILFDTVSKEECTSGLTDYRCVYIHNASTADTLNAKLWISNANGVQVTSGLGTSPAGGTEQTINADTVAPIGVTFTPARSLADGLVLGAIGPGQGRAVWLCRTIPAGTAAGNQSFDLVVEVN